MKKPNKPDVVNPAMALWFGVEHQWRRVTDLECCRSTMESKKNKAWRVIRGAAALLLGVVLASAAIAHNGFRMGNATIIIGYMAVALSVIYVSMWRRWHAEIVGWVLLVIFFLGSGMA
jgi:hypothetical protein